MPLSETIDAIVAKRNSVAGIYSEKVNNATGWQTFVNSLLEFFERRGTIWNSVLEDSKSQDEALIIKSKIEEFKEHVDVLLGKNEDGKSLRAASERANRGYVNLGIIGPWRIGKSQIVQQLTNLDTWLIPTDSSDNCTACPINVVNGQFNGNSDIAVINVYSVKEMCSNINGYIEHCGLGNAVPFLNATTKEEFKNQCASRFETVSQMLAPGGDEKGYFDKMKDYLDHVDEYYNYLSDEDPEPIKNIKSIESKRLFRPYVSYYSVPDVAEQTYQCLATKSATLYTDFRFLDESIAGLRILDTPGIGECKLNVSEGLSKALRYDLDIAVATAVARPNFDDKSQIQRFHEILKKETSGRNPEKWLYYLYNVFSTVPGMTSTVLKTRHNFIERDLGDEIIDGSGIILDKTHYADIDALVNKGIRCPAQDGVGLRECQVSTISLSTFFDSILRKMVDSIKNVDDVFYEEANTRYDKVKREFDELMIQLKNLPIIDYKNTIMISITQQMTFLCNEIGKFTSKLELYAHSENYDIEHNKTLSQKIAEYCSPKGYGMALLKALKMIDSNETDYATCWGTLNEDLSKNIVKLWDDEMGLESDEIIKIHFDYVYELIKTQLTTEEYITESRWNSNQDFDGYIRLKRSLIDIIEKDVLSQYDKEQAEDSLLKEKKKILDVYYTIGKFGKIVNVRGDEWCNDFISLLEKENQYKRLRETFEKFLNYQLNIEDSLTQNIKTLRRKKQHRDQFIYDTDILFPFEDYDKAIKAFAFSLFNIEVQIKTTLAGTGENSYESFIMQQEGHFNDSMEPIRTIAAAETAGYSDVGQELMTLYMAHGDIFEDDTIAVKNAAVMEWKKLITYNE